ncbi:MAG TPA: ArsI/CadI family heavy metal resistance metalloenzyme [Polyangiaceae bacterium]|jgi:catechol 2,3-dioxygenase-like lactoylglutathione lyase family enzyme|nr:ArsI/CadI family heavy metal resistance metalloenzyme [Polyangiaceae bacterium]
MNILKPHVSLNVSNIDASVAFYEKAFGVPATKRRPGYAKFDLSAPSLNLTMQEAPRTGINASHFGIQVERSEDVAAAWTRFKQAGLATKTEENTECCYALQDKVWIADPDGNAWEVFVVKGEAPVMETRAEGGGKGRGCCAPKISAMGDEDGAPGEGAAAKDAASKGAAAKDGGGCCG